MGNNCKAEKWNIQLATSGYSGSIGVGLRSEDAGTRYCRRFILRGRAYPTVQSFTVQGGDLPMHNTLKLMGSRYSTQLVLPL
jgi:hypothetical protein